MREIGAAQALLTNAALALVVLAVGLVGVRVGGLVPARLLIAGGTAGVLPLVAASHAGEGSAALDELTAALRKAIDDQMKHGKTTLIEAMINQELGEPFRRDAMKKPVKVAGIDKADMKPQVVG